MCTVGIRYILDGDREELRTIRHELAALKNSTSTGGGTGDRYPDKYQFLDSSSRSVLPNPQSHFNPYAPQLSRVSPSAAAAAATDIPASFGEEEKSSSPPRSIVPQPPHNRAAMTADVRMHETPTDTAIRIRSELAALYASGLYSSAEDPVVSTLLSALRSAEAQAAAATTIPRAAADIRR
jgi:hypothetical protein